MTPDQSILCFRSARIEEAFGERRGFLEMGEEEIREAFPAEKAWLGPRGPLENDASFKQVIPYTLLVSGGQVAMYMRAEGGDEGRLHGLASIGFGGHVTADDLIVQNEMIDPLETARGSAFREMAEEVEAAPVAERRFLGVIYHGKTEVDRSHVGFVQVCVLEEAYAKPLEEDIGRCEFMSPDEVDAYEGDFETWTDVLRPHLGSIIG